MNEVRLIDANALKYKNLAEVNGRLTYVLTAEEIDTAPTVPLPNEQITWEQGYECGFAQAKEGVIRRIAKQYSAHNELIPEWLSVGDMKGGAE